MDKDSKEYQERIKKAFNNFLASSGVVLNKSCPTGIHVGVAVVGCKCNAVFLGVKSNPDPYWNLTTAGQLRGDQTK